MSPHNRHALETMIKSLETEKNTIIQTFDAQIEQLRSLLGQETLSLPPAPSAVIDLEHQSSSETGTPVFAPPPVRAASSGSSSSSKKPGPKKRKMSNEARARIAEAQRKRWAAAKRG